MPVRFRKNCKVCIAVKGNPRLLKRIYASKFYTGKGGESLLLISREEGLKYESLNAHVKKHQAISDEALEEQKAQLIAKEEERKQLTKLVRSGTARQSALDKLAAELEKRDMSELTARDVVALVLKASKDTDDVAAKAKDQDIDIMRMMGAIRSGEVKDIGEEELFDPWATAEEGELVDP